MDAKKARYLFEWIDRWLHENSRRTLQTLSKKTGVPYPTLRRVMQGEGEPTTDTALSLLNVVATLEECLQYFESVESVRSFYERVTANTLIAPSDLLEKYLDSDSFWVLHLGLTLGATQRNVEHLLGVEGVERFEEMITEGVLREKTGGVYEANVENASIYVENKRVARAAVKSIAAIPSEDDPLERFIVYDLTEESYRAIRQRLLDAYRDCDTIAKTGGPGPIMGAFSFVAKQVTSEGEKT